MRMEFYLKLLFENHLQTLVETEGKGLARNMNALCLLIILQMNYSAGPKSQGTLS